MSRQLLSGPALVLAILAVTPFLLANPADKFAAKGDGPVKEITNSIGMKFRLIPKGKFLMGSGKAEQDDALKNAADDEARKDIRAMLDRESPQHEVEITRPFYLGVYTVTQKQYKEVMDENPSEFSASGNIAEKVKGLNTDDFPAEYMYWDDAVAFCKKLSARQKEKRSGRAYRLPTEAEWEYACRAGTITPFHFGRLLSSKEANFDGEKPYGGAEKGPNLGRTCKVGSYKPNAWGLYDMHGNVTQWCSDLFEWDYYKTSPKKDPKGPVKGTDKYRTWHSLRGSSFDAPAVYCRSAHRFGNYGRTNITGFRVVLSVPAK